MVLFKICILYIIIVEEVDVIDFEDLWVKLNGKYGDECGKLIVLLFVVCVIVEVVCEQLQMNVIFDDEVGVIFEFGVVNIGIVV